MLFDDGSMNDANIRKRSVTAVSFSSCNLIYYVQTFSYFSKYSICIVEMRSSSYCSVSFPFFRGKC